jgi:hypothetical protein
LDIKLLKCTYFKIPTSPMRVLTLPFLVAASVQTEANFARLGSSLVDGRGAVKMQLDRSHTQVSIEIESVGKVTIRRCA